MPSAASQAKQIAATGQRQQEGRESGLFLPLKVFS
jgi:hypothetical protein